MFNILLVDDEPFICEGLKSFIAWQDYGFTVKDTARNGEQAVERLKDRGFHLVITDVRMPVMDGISLAAHVREHYPGIQVIILSGYKDFEYAQRAMTYSVCGYLLKPIQKDELAEMLNKARERIVADARVKNWGYSKPGEETDIKILQAAISGSAADVRKEVSVFLDDLYRQTDSENQPIPAYQKRFAILRYINEFNARLSESNESTLNMIPASTFWNILNEIDDRKKTEEALTSLCLSFGEIISAREQQSLIKMLPTILKYLKENLNKEINLKSTAAAFYINPVYLGKIFKREMNMAFSDYLHRLRVQRAKDLVGFPDMTVSEIVLRTGYSTPEYFYKMFKKYEGESFADYRKKKEGTVL